MWAPPGRATADALLVEDRLETLADVLEIARDAMALIRSNLRAAAGVNPATLAGAATGRLAPATTARLHNGTTIAVLLRAMRHGKRASMRGRAGRRRNDRPGWQLLPSLLFRRRACHAAWTRWTGIDPAG